MSLARWIEQNRKITLREALFQMKYGKARRETILKCLKDPDIEGSRIAVNVRYTCQLHQDPDLRYMLKKGILKRTKEVYYPKTSYTFLVINDVRN